MGLRVYKDSGTDLGHPGIFYASWDVVGLFRQGYRIIVGMSG